MAQPATQSSSASRFVATGQDGVRIVSTDGKSWRSEQHGKEGEFYRAAAFGNGKFVVAGTYGGSNIFASSTDGEKWTTGTKDGQYKNFIRGLCFGKGQFLALGGDPGSVGGSEPFILSSEDGVKWSDYTKIAGKNILRRTAFGNDRFVAVGDRGRRAWSKDGREWVDVTGVKATDTLVDIAFGKGVFAGVGLHGLRMTSEDGVKWSEKMLGEEGEHLNSIVWADDRFVAVGAGATWTSPDGIKWTRNPNKDAPNTVAYGNGVFVGASWKSKLMRSTDGVAWEQVYKGEFNFEAVAFGAI